jgi:quinol monooxygenase YgiN
MKPGQALKLGLPLIAPCLLLLMRSGFAQQPQDRIVRIADIEIYPDQLEKYKAALTEEIAASIRTEPGVITLYAVSEKGHPEQIQIFEIYRNTASYEAHLKSPHFVKYKQQTQQMVKSLKLIETDPIALGTRLK